MQIIILTLLLLGLAVAARTQNFSEWWQQKKTRIRYLTEQAIALEALEKTVANGYEIAGDGLHVIGDTTNAEFHLHQDYFRSLSMVSEAVRHSPAARGCAEEQKYLYDQSMRFLEAYHFSPWLTADEQNSAFQVYDAINEQLSKYRKESIALLTDDSLSMTDGDRLRALKALYQQSKQEADHYDAIEAEIALVITMRRRDSGEETLLKILE